MKRITDEERRLRLVQRHHLGGDATSVDEAASAMVGLHSSDPATVFLSIRARRPSTAVEEIEDALYTRKSLLRLLGMRRTLWVAPVGLAPTINSSSTVFYADAQMRRTIAMLEKSDLGSDASRWLERMCDRIVETLSTAGEATGRQLTEAIPELSRKITFYKADGSIAGSTGSTTRLLFLLTTQARVLRTRPLGSWISSQYNWSTPTGWLGEELERLPEEQSRADLLAGWLRSFGPGTERDIKWWTGWPVTSVRKTLKIIDAEQVELDEGAVGFDLADARTEPTLDDTVVSFLPSLDPTTMGWHERSFYIPAGYDELFDRNGNAGPTIWLNGAVVGAWAQRDDGEIATEMYQKVTSRQTEKIAHEKSKLREWIGDIRVTPRFRSPSDKRLSSGP